MSRLLRIALVPALVSLAFAQSDEGWRRVDVAAPKFEVQSTGGDKLTEQALKGKVTVVDFWATWCGPCVQELPELAKFSGKMKDRKDVAFLSFSVDDDKAAIARFFEGRKEKFPVYLAASLADRMDVMNFPTKLIIDGRKGSPTIRFRKEGTIEASELEARIVELLAKP